MLIEESLPTLRAGAGRRRRAPMSSRASSGCATRRSATATTRSPPTARRRSSSACSTRRRAAAARRKRGAAVGRRSPPGWSISIRASNRFGAAGSPTTRRPDASPPSPTASAATRGAGRRDPGDRRDLRPPSLPPMRIPRRRSRSVSTACCPTDPMAYVRRICASTQAPAARTMGREDMKLGILTAPFPDTPLAEVADWASGARLRGAGDRLLAEIHRPDPPLCRHQPHRRRRPLRLAGQGDRRRAGREGPRRSPALGYYPNPLHPDPAHRETVIDHLKKVIVAAEPHGRAGGQHLLRRRRVEARRRQLAGRAQGLAGHHRPCRATTASSSPSRTAR